MSFLSPSEFYARQQWTSFMSPSELCAREQWMSFRSPSELYARERTVDVLLQSIRTLCQTHSNGCPFAVHLLGAALHTARLPLFIPNSSVQFKTVFMCSEKPIILCFSQSIRRFPTVHIRVVKLLPVLGSDCMYTTTTTTITP